MKRISIYTMLSAAALLFAVASCTNENLQADGSFITLKLSSRTSAKPDLAETKAETKPGVDELNENTINDVYYFFYKNGETEADPVISGRIAGIGQKGTSAKTEDVPVKSDIASSLFVSSDSCQVFIVANPPKSMETTLQGTPTLKELRALTLTTTLTETQESFTMVFDSKAAKIATSGNIMTVEANLQRLASKLTFAINTAKTCTDAGSTEWTSDPDKAKISFYNAFKKTNLAGDFEAVKKADSEYTKNYFNSTAIAFAAKTAKDTDTWSNKAEKPVYSYPEAWDFVSSKEPYVLIELPWTMDGTTTPVTYYYKVFLNAKELKMNTWCHLTVSIDQLGSLTPDDPAQLFSNMNYLVLNWNNAFESGEGIMADVEDTRYLMLNKKTFTLYNQDAWDIPYTSSHECTIKDISYTKINYKNGAGTPETITNPAELPSRLSITCNGSLILFEHELVNNINLTTGGTAPDGAYDVAPYTIEFTICHNTDDSETDALYEERISVTQYPAIYIDAQQNSCGAVMRTKSEAQSLGLSYKNTAFVNLYGNDNVSKNSQTVRDNFGGDPYWAFQETGLTIGNKNGHMYVLTTSTAPDLEVVPGDASTKYIIGDPRKLTADNPWANYSELPWLGSSATDHQPTYYYPTVTADRAANVIAPKLRVASSWGQTLQLTYANALRRCAAYQEDGYPAGRWRMPTAAELMYICKLSEHHMIPMLYGSAGNDLPSHYWCSTGFIEVYRSFQSNYTTPMKPNGDTEYHKLNESYEYLQRTNYTDGTYRDNLVDYIPGETKFSVRCVYDEWYWENTSDAVEIGGTTVNTVNGRMPEGYYDVRVWGDRKR